MNSSDLIPNEHDLADPASDEVQFALVIARMIDPMKNNPEDMRQVVYNLARYKLQEQFTSADAQRLGIRSRRSKLPFAASRNSRGQISLPSPRLDSDSTFRSLPEPEREPPP